MMPCTCSMCEPCFARQLIERVRAEWARDGGEFLEIENIKGTVYGFGDETITLRLLKRYRDCPQARQGYSTNLETYYFSLEVSV